MNLKAFSVIALTVVVLWTAKVTVMAKSDIPTLDEMAGDWIPMENVANPPAVHNFHDMLLVGRDLTSFYCYPDDWLWNGAPRFGYPPVNLTISGKQYQASE